MRPNISFNRTARVGWFLLLTVFGLVCFPLKNAVPVHAQITTSAAVLSDPTVVQMTGMSISKTIPPEAVPGIDLRLGGGSYPGCLDVPEAPVVDYKTDNMDLTGVALIATCGWEADELVKVTLMDPQGKFYTYESRAVPSKNRKDIFKVDLYFQPGVDAPEGKYRFTLQGSPSHKNGGTVKTHVFFNRTSGARLYAVPENRFEPVLQPLGGKHKLRLDKFLPNEWVRILVYQFKGTAIEFFAWQDFTADKTGRLIVDVNLPDIDNETILNFYAYGQETHSVHLERFNLDGLRVNRQYDMDLFCAGGQTPRLAGVSEIKAAAEVEAVPILQQPGYGSRVIIRAPADAHLQVYGYPKCIDRAYWWKVTLKEPVRFGWVAESYLGRYRIEAIP